MKRELKEKWLAALRGEQYQQGRGTLRSFDRFCCLGVLCDVIDPSRWASEYAPGGLYAYREEDDTHWESVVPPNLREKIGLEFHACSQLASMNDGIGSEWYGKPQNFKQIADHIEQQIPADD